MAYIDVEMYCENVCGHKGMCTVEQRRVCSFGKKEYHLRDPLNMSQLRNWFTLNFETNDDWYEIILKQLNEDFIMIPRGEIR